MMPNLNKKKVAVVIPNLNRRDLLNECLKSLRSQSFRDFSTIVVDNGSNDDSVSFIKGYYPEVKIIRMDRNTGFAFAINQGIKEAFNNEECIYVITLNNDTKCDENYLRELIHCAENHRNFGSIQPKVLAPDGITIDCTGIVVSRDISAYNRGYRKKDSAEFEKEVEIFGASASASLYSRDALEKTRLMGDYFDEDYFAYYEDVDLAWRMRLNGFSSYYCPKAKVLHLHSATGGKNSYFVKFHLHRNQYYNIIKILPFWMMVKALLFMPVRYLLVLHSILANKRKAPKIGGKKEKKSGFAKHIFKGWADVLKNINLIIKKRKIIQNKKIIGCREINRLFQKYGVSMKKIVYG